MRSDDLAAMIMETAGLLNAKVLDSSLNTCQLEMGGTQIKLSILEGPSGSYISGKMELAPLEVEESGKEILYAMYMNGTLHESFGFPLWFGMDAEDNRLLACFSLTTFDLTASGLAEALKPLEEIGASDFPF
jgi:hypothetical protein